MRPTLEEERRALLEQIEASRALYRRMLSKNDKSHIDSASRQDPFITNGFPRSHTMRWIIAHRWQLAIGLGALLLLRPARKLTARRAAALPARPSGGALKAVAVAGANLLRKRNSLQLAGRLSALLLRWMQQRRA
jgi:hypothetical protein